MKKLFKKSVIILISVFSISSCSKIDLDPSKRKPTELLQDIAVPIATGDFSVGDLLRSDTNSFADIDENGRIWLTYSNELKSIETEELMTPKGGKMEFYQTITAAQSNSSMNVEEVIVPFSSEMSFNVSSPSKTSPKLTALHVKEGKLFLDIGNYVNGASKLTLTIPSIVKGGRSFTATISLDPRRHKMVEFDLTGYIIKPVNTNTKNNKIPVYVNAIVTKKLTEYLVGSFKIGVELDKAMKLEVIYGDFKRQNFLHSNTSSIDFKFLKNAPSSTSVKFKDFKIGMQWLNSFGIPMEMEVQNIIGVNNQGENFHLDVKNIKPDFLIFDAPVSPGVEKSGMFTFDENNTFTGGGAYSSTDFIKKDPIQMSFSGFTYTNPLKYNYPAFKNFIWQKSALSISVETAFLLYGTVTDYKFEEVTEIKMGEDVSNVKSATIKLHSENGFPLEFKTQLEFRDIYDSVLFTIANKEELFLTSGQLNSLGRVVAPAINNREFDLNEKEVGLLPKVSKVAIVANFSTTDNGNRDVIFNEKDRLVLKLGLRLKYINEIIF